MKRISTAQSEEGRTEFSERVAEGLGTTYHVACSPSTLPHVRVLGVTCSTKVALLTKVEDGAISANSFEKIEVGALHEASAELVATLEEISRALAHIEPDLVVLLMPEQSRFSRPHSEVAARVALETLVRLAAASAEIPVEILPRPTVRARLKLPKKGDLASHVEEVYTEPVGRYWGAGRNVAALAARAGEVGP